MNRRSSQPVQVATGAPLLRVVLVVLLLTTAVAGLLVTGGVPAGWLVLGLVLVAGPVAVMVEGRARNRASLAAGAGVSEPGRFRSPASPARPEQRPHREAA